MGRHRHAHAGKGSRATTTGDRPRSAGARLRESAKRARNPDGPMPILGITGAAGYVGGAIAARARAKGWEVVGVDDHSGPIASVHPAFEAVRADFASPAGLKALSSADVLLHLAAVSGVVACAENPAATRRVNVEGTGRLLVWCRERRIPVAFASSLAVVGSPKEMPVTEETAPGPTHEYARQKTEGEAAVEALNSRGVPAFSVRMSNIYGTYRANGRDVAKGNVLNAFVDQAKQGTLRVNAPGTQRRDFLHVEDAAQGWLALARMLKERTTPPVPRFLFARGRSYSILEVAEAVRSAWTKARPGTPVPRVEVVPNPRGAIELLDERFEVDPRRTWNALGMRPRHEVSVDLLAMLQAGRPSA